MEIELKLALPASALPKLLRHPALAGVKAGRTTRTRIVATYFDTADDRLAKEGIALRVRRQGSRWVQAIKAATAATGGGLAARTEHEWPLPRAAQAPAPDLARLGDVALGRAVARVIRKQPLVPRFITQFQRTSMPLRFADGTTARADIDRGHLRAARGATHKADFAELELELQQGNVARLFELAASLVADLPLAVEPRSKAERGYALIHVATPVPQRAVLVGYARNATSCEAITAIVRNCLRQIEANADGVAHEDDPEWVHQLRVGVRRLRAALAIARPLLVPGVTDALGSELRWLANALGPARDLDVFVATTLPALRAGLARALEATTEVDAIVATLAAQAAAQRDAARVEARAAVASPRFQRILLAAGQLAAQPPLGESATTTRPSALSFARAVLKRRHARLLRAGTHLADGSPSERHALRIAAKKLRYATEFLAPCFPGKRLRVYRDALASLQDVLGELNDGSVATALATQLAGGHTPAATLLAGWTAARTAAREPALQRAWNQFVDARPHWST